MAQRGPFFTSEVGEFLKSLRQAQGLTLEQVAEGLELSPRGGKAFVRRLEQGKVRDPHLRTIVRYLRAVGARLRDIEPLLDRTELLPIPAEVVAVAKIDPARKTRVLAEVGHDVHKYEIRMARPPEGLPLPPAKQRRASERFLDFVLLARIVREAIREYLMTTNLGFYDWDRYQVYGRRRLGVLRRRSGRKLAARLAVVEEDARMNRLRPEVCAGVDKVVEEMFTELTRDSGALSRLRREQQERLEQMRLGLERRARLEPEAARRRSVCNDEVLALMPAYHRQHKVLTGASYLQVVAAFVECWLKAVEAALPGLPEFCTRLTELLDQATANFAPGRYDAEMVDRVREIVVRNLGRMVHDA